MSDPRALLLRYLQDAQLHWLDTFRRTALELDRMGEGLTDDEVLAQTVEMSEKAWLTLEALRTH